MRGMMARVGKPASAKTAKKKILKGKCNKRVPRSNTVHPIRRMTNPKIAFFPRHEGGLWATGRQPTTTATTTTTTTTTNNQQQPANLESRTFFAVQDEDVCQFRI